MKRHTGFGYRRARTVTDFTRTQVKTGYSFPLQTTSNSPLEDLFRRSVENSLSGISSVKESYDGITHSVDFHDIGRTVDGPFLQLWFVSILPFLWTKEC